MEIAVGVLGALTILAVLAAWYSLRWVRMRRGGGVSVALRWRPDEARSSWHLGLGRYEGEQFVWFRVWSLRTGPDRVFERVSMEVADRRDPSGTEAYAVPEGSIVLRCESATQEAIEIAMGPGALTGFLSWLESAPPGRRLPRAS
ncbi:DUF2550 domain-containing protein [Amycolatopsis regifaucium]|uniref:DUF2550 domain-containing protein n=1 Tax=Amycolatopsis regifaucium TaxID=546365 RepID=A0A154MKE8_9PSEU|nr:DUF2550 domain-containing protein [Amycolatopsis regifaucium]KZB83879.1 hypothetical protein AVL48_35470 [Amycolatopsis regifaucium]OKA06677.1 hypothetical protein ATP06_0219140 [Amycolatopsis regifaucium]SFH23643.1 Protein of unknown function [Amycolatopsis regifaucium]